MEYDIIKQVAGLSSSTSSLDAELASAAGIILKSCACDQCSLYLWDEKQRRFLLKSSSGPGLKADSYSEGEGIPGEALKKMRPVTYKGGDEVRDKGLNGFRFAYAVPVEAAGSFYGVLYFKSKAAPRAPGFMKEAQSAAALLALTLKCERAESRCRQAYAELNDARGKLERTEKLMALVDMASSLAHEIKNPLVSIGGYAARLKKHIGESPEALPYVEQMLGEIRRVEKLIDGIMRFLKDSAAEKHPEDVNDILKDALKFFDEDFRASNIKLVINLHHGALPINADREQLTIAFDNLIANAIQSMENGGRLTLSTGIRKDTVVVRITDSGGGIDPAVISYIFNPFFTTKKNGTGLGLPITNSIMLRHNGCIEVENQLGVGVTFVLKLPLAG